MKPTEAFFRVSDHSKLLVIDYSCLAAYYLHRIFRYMNNYT